jgi:hypothetical protein
MQTFANPSPEAYDNFGFRIAAVGDNVLISAWNDDTVATNAGAAYLFESVATTETDANGHYSFIDLDPGTYEVREVVRSGFVQTAPGGDGTYSVFLATGENVTGRDFGNEGAFFVDDVTLVEGNTGTTEFRFTVSRGSKTQIATVDFATADGTATAPADHESVSGRLIFQIGEAEKTIVVPVVGDTEAEADEHFEVVLFNAAGAALDDARGVGTILSDDWYISIEDVTATEGDDSPHYRGPFVQSASLQNFVAFVFGPDGHLYGTAQDAGSAIDRYDGATGELLDRFVQSGHVHGVRSPLFRDGFLYVGSEYTDEVLRFDANGDFYDVFVTAGAGGIDGPHGMAFGPDANGDTIPELYVSGRNSHNVVRYDGATGAPLGSYITSGAGGLGLPEGLTFDPQQQFVFVASSSGTGAVRKYDALTGDYLGVGAGSPASSPKDVKFGPDGLMYVASAGNDRILRFTATGDYVDDFAPAGLAGIDDPNHIKFGPDGDLYVSGPGFEEIMRLGTEPEAVIEVTLSPPSGLPVTVDYATADNTALAGSDYTTINGSITFHPGHTTQFVRVPILDDAFTELAESFFVDLSNPNGASIQDGRGLVTILDDESFLAGDGFESGDFSGGEYQWGTGSWTVSGDTTISSDGPASGMYHARLRNESGELIRAVDTTGISDVRLSFSARLNSLESGDKGVIQFSSDGSSWITIDELNNGDNQDHHYAYDITDVPDTLYIRFDAQMSKSG